MKPRLTRENYDAARAGLAAEEWNYYPDVSDWPTVFMQWSSVFETLLSGEESRSRGSSSSEPSGAFDQVNWAAASFAEKFGAEMVGRTWSNGRLVDNSDTSWAISGSMRKWLKQSILDAFVIGRSPLQLAKLIQESGHFSKHAAVMLAHTEIGNANVWSHYAQSLHDGANAKRIFLSADHNHDDVCGKAAEMGEVPIDFAYPGGSKVPLFHPLCRCSVSFYWRR